MANLIRYPLDPEICRIIENERSKFIKKNMGMKISQVKFSKLFVLPKLKEITNATKKITKK